MDIRNKILIISDIPEQILEFRQKLSGLKSTNLIYSARIENAFATCKKFIPDVVIVFTDRTRPAKYIQFCRSIKSNANLKNISILFMFEDLDENFLLSGYDAGISDYMILPAKNIDILTRVIWAFQKKELLHELEKKENILKYANVIDNKTETYTSGYVEYALTSAINTANKYQYPVVLMAITLDPKFQSEENEEYLATIIKNSTRKTDIVGAVNNRNYFLLLNRTNLNGAHIVYNKLTDKLGELSISVGMSIGICESFSGMDHKILISCAVNALNEAIKRGGNRIVVFNKNVSEEEELKDEIQNNKATESHNNDDSSQNWLNKITSSKKKYEFFSQEFTKKVHFIISPVFFKVQNYLNENYTTNLLIDQFTTDTKCYFSVKEISSGNECLLQIIDPGTSKVVIETSFISLGKQINKRTNIEIQDLTLKNLETIIMGFLNEFERISEFTKSK